MNLAGVDLNLLVALDALLAERNVTRAAQRVGISQPGMSSALARLRKLLGDPLLVREGNRLVPTARGISLAEPVRTALATIELALNDRVDFDPLTDEVTFDVSCSDYTSLQLVAPLTRRLATEAPGVTIRLQPRAPDPAAALLSGEVDLVIEPVAVMEETTPLASQTLFEDRWLCCVWAGNTRVGDRINRREFSRLSHISFSMGAGKPRSLVDDHLESLAIPRRIEMTVESFLMAPVMLQETDLLTFVLERAAPFIARTADIRTFDPPVAIPPIMEAMWWSPSRTTDPALAWLRRALEDISFEITASYSSHS